MLSTISWTTYFSIVLLFLVVYYIAISWKFYSEEIRDLFAGKKKLAFVSGTSAQPVQRNEDQAISDQQMQPELFETPIKNLDLPDEADDTVEQVKVLTNSIRKVVTEASEKKYVKEEFFLSLQLLLKQYSFLKGTPALPAINNLIASECERHGYIHLSAEERVMLWNES